MFDAHSDILYDVIHNNRDFAYHLERLSKYRGVIINYYFKGNESHDEFLFVLLKVKSFYEQYLCKLKKPKILLGIEGLGPLRTVEDIDILYKAHINSVSLTWNDVNLLGSGTFTHSHQGLTKLGYKVLDRLYKYGIMLDLSHANKKTFFDALNYFKGKVFVSHSNAKSICDNERNLEDEQLIAVAKKGGLIGINGYKEFVGKDCIDGIIEHINYIKTLIGIDHICLGIDDDTYLTNNSGMISPFKSGVNIDLLKKSLEKTFSKEEVKKILYGNFENWINDDR